MVNFVTLKDLLYLIIRALSEGNDIVISASLECVDAYNVLLFFFINVITSARGFMMFLFTSVFLFNIPAFIAASIVRQLLIYISGFQHFCWLYKFILIVILLMVLWQIFLTRVGEELAPSCTNLRWKEHAALLILFV